MIKWKNAINRQEYPDEGTECFCEVWRRGYLVLTYKNGEFMDRRGMCFIVTVWCELSKIISILEAGIDETQVPGVKQ